MQSKHDRKIVLGAVALTFGSINNDWKIWPSLMDNLEQEIVESAYLENAPFLWMSLIFRYGLKNETIPHYRRIHPKYGNLALALELGMRVLLTADETDPKMLKDFFEIATLDALIHAGKKYKLPIQVLEHRRSMLGKILDWEFDMRAHRELLHKRYMTTKLSIVN